MATSARRPIVPVRHVTLPFHVTTGVDHLPGETIAAFLARTGSAVKIGKLWSFKLPTVCVVNGAPLLQRFWKRRRIKAGDVVEFWSRPWGKSGSGKMIIGIVALIALAAFAPWAAAGISAALFAGAGAGIITGVIMAAGGMLIGALVAPEFSRWQRLRDWFFTTCSMWRRT